MFPAGFGWSGSTVKNNGAVVTMGLPSLGGVLPLAKKIYLNDNYDVDGSITIQPRGWVQVNGAGVAPTDPVLMAGGQAANASAIVLARMVLHGRLYAPSTV